MHTKSILALGLTLLTAATVYLNTEAPENTRDLFRQWAQVHGKVYGKSESEYRYQIWAQNLAHVVAHNALYQAGQESIELSMNGFADLTNEEFSKRYLSSTKSERQISQVRQASGVQVPDSVDFRPTGRVSSVKNQASCGSCWAFTAVAALEGALRVQYPNIELSEQELVDCATGVGYEDSNGCQGGEIRDALRYVQLNKLAILSEYPYEAANKECRRSSTKTRYGISGFTNIAHNDAKAYVEAAASNLLSVTINASGINFQLYKKGIYNKPCDSTFSALNHGVTSVGYTPDAYILKNSWGSGWGEEGYIRFARIEAAEGQCGVHQDVYFAIA